MRNIFWMMMINTQDNLKKGTEYYSNGKIMFEGCWVNDNLEGYVKIISENG